MKAASILVLIGCLTTVTESKVYTCCKLAKIFSRAGLDNFKGFSLGNWICMAYYESHYNSMAQKFLKDGSIDYGIFQINSDRWCRRTEFQEKNYCHITCSALLNDDLMYAIICAKIIVRETEGMNYL
ncbi:lysozyme-like protein 1 [Rhynchonycteris naso]